MVKAKRVVGSVQHYAPTDSRASLAAQTPCPDRSSRAVIRVARRNLADPVRTALRSDRLRADNVVWLWSTEGCLSPATSYLCCKWVRRGRSWASITIIIITLEVKGGKDVLTRWRFDTCKQACFSPAAPWELRKN